MTHNVTARDVPELRADMIQGAEFFSSKAPGFHPWAPSHRIAELYWVCDKMRNLAQNMAEDLPEYVVHPDDLPSDHGILVWEGVVEEAAGLAWKKVGGHIVLTVLVPREAAIRMFGEATGDKKKADLLVTKPSSPAALWSEAEIPLAFGTVMKPGDMLLASLGAPKDAVWAELMPRIAVSMWILLGQTFAASEIVRPSKAGMKRLARLDAALLMNTRYVTLRRSESGAYEGSGTGTGHHYSVRFPVRGHKRKIQDKDNPGQTRTIQVRGHIRGPEGAPMRDSSRRVNVLRK